MSDKSDANLHPGHGTAHGTVVASELTTSQFNFDPFTTNESLYQPPAVKTPQHREGRRKFFALRRGRYTKGCIYVEEQDLLAQINGFEGAEYMEFYSLDSAFRYIANPEMNPVNLRMANGEINNKAGTDTDEWERRYNELANFYNLYGTSDVPYHSVLGNFAASQKVAYAAFLKGEASCLTQDRIDRLKTIEFCFGGNKDRKLFTKWLEELILYRKRNGGNDPPGGSMLQKWIWNNKKRYIEFKRGNDSVAGMDASRCQMLEEVGFHWTQSSWVESNVSISKDIAVQDHSELLTAIDDAIGTGKQDESNFSASAVREMSVVTESILNTPRGCNDSTIESATIEHDKRNHISGSGCSASASASASASTNVPRSNAGSIARHTLPTSNSDPLWDQMFQSFKLFYPDGNAANATSGKQTSIPLDQWIIDQKHAYTAFVTGKKRKRECEPALTEERVLLLKNAGFQLQEPVVAPPKKKKKKTDLLSDEMWDNMQQELREFKAVHGHTIPPVQPNTLLRQWVNKVRAEYKKFIAGDSSVLTAERIQSLNDVEFQFARKYKPRTWEARFEELIKFKANFGHCKVPRLFDQANFEGLGKWVADQRAKYNKMIRGKKSNMTAEKAKKLSELGMVWAVFKLAPKEERAERKPWSHRFQELLEFEKQYGHTRVPQHFPVLGQWVHSQRVNYKLLKQNRKSAMTAEQALQLEQVGFEFEVMPRKNQNVQQSLGNPFPNLPLIESKTDKPTEATKLISDSGQPIYTVVNQPNENDAASGMES